MNIEDKQCRNGIHILRDANSLWVLFELRIFTHVHTARPPPRKYGDFRSSATCLLMLELFQVLEGMGSHKGFRYNHEAVNHRLWRACTESSPITHARIHSMCCWYCWGPSLGRVVVTLSVVVVSERVVGCRRSVLSYLNNMHHVRQYATRVKWPDFHFPPLAAST
jgi:hypothetical protein